MNGLKRCVLAGMASCLLMMPGFSLAEGAPGSDVTTQAAAAEATSALPEANQDSGVSRAVQNKDYEQALQIVNRRIEDNPNNADLYARRGLIYLMMDRTDESLADNDKAVSLEPDNASLYLNRGTVYEKRRDYKLAIKDYTQALTLSKPGEPYQVMAYFNRARTYTKSDSYDLALADIRQGEKIMPYFSQNYFLESQIYQKQGKKQLAKQRMDIGTAYELMHQGHYLLASVTVGKIGMNEMALNLVNKAVEQDPGNWEVYSVRGLIYANLLQHEKGIADLTKSLSMHETSIDYNNRGECYRHLKQYNKARKDYANALRLAETDADYHAVYDSIGQLALDQGDYKKAVEYLTKSIAIEPYAEGYKLRSQAFRKLGDNQKADQDEVSAQELMQRDLLE